MNSEDCMEQNFKELRLIRNDNTELVIDNFYMDLDPLFLAAESLLDNREHLLTDQLKPLFVEKRDELVEDLHTHISKSASKLGDMVIYYFIKENGNE